MRIKLNLILNSYICAFNFENFHDTNFFLLQFVKYSRRCCCIEEITKEAMEIFLIKFKKLTDDYYEIPVFIFSRCIFLVWFYRVYIVYSV